MKQNPNLVKFTSDLINFKSITPDEGGSLKFIANILEKKGFKVILKEFGPEECKTTNLYAVYGEDGPNLCFAGHVDVVPPGNLELWDADPFTASIKNDEIYGRGAVDMKGAIAAYIYALLDFIAENKNFRGRLSVLLTSDEEGSGTYGILEMLKYLTKDGHKLDFTIIGEPTSDKVLGDNIKIGRRGSISFKLTVKGTQGHIAYPELCLNPNHLAVDILYKLIHHNFDKGNEFFTPTSLQISSIDVGNPTGNLIPAEASINFNIRFNNLHSKASLVEQIESLVFSVHKDIELTHQCSSEAFIGEHDNFINRFGEIVKEVTGIQAEFTTTGGISDAKHIKNYSKFLEFGLLNITAHKINEKVEINDLHKIYNVYYMAMQNFIKEYI